MFLSDFSVSSAIFWQWTLSVKLAYIMGKKFCRVFFVTFWWKFPVLLKLIPCLAKSLYAPIEGEALSVADALDKARFFILGYGNLIIAVDHLPLHKECDYRSPNYVANTILNTL